MLDKIYVLHYTRVPERRESMEEFLNDIKVPVEWIVKYDAEDLTDADYERYHNEDISEYNRKIKTYDGHMGQKAPDFKRMNINEISCTIKHLQAIEKLAKGRDEIALILEDDAIPSSKDFIEKINSDLKDIDLDEWDSIFIGNGIGDSFINKIQKTRRTETLFRVGHPATNCAEAYILKKNSAKKLMESMIPFQQISDWEMSCAFFEKDMKIYWRLPSLIYQGSRTGKFNSTLR